MPELSMFPTPAHIQQELINQGYDLGPAGADGDIGPKSRAAIKQFEIDNELPYPDGIPDAAFMKKLAGNSVKKEEPTKPAEVEAPESDDEPLETPEDRAPVEEPESPPKVVDAVDSEAPDEEPGDEGEGNTSRGVAVVVVAVLAVILAIVGRAMGLY
jgi:peptidoglycan hydrolase-like protein with peptidoglycan-binding domain